MWLVVLLSVGLGASAASAQHRDVLYGVNDGHVKTGATDFDLLQLVPDVRVFADTFVFNAGQGGYWTDDPGHTSSDSPPGMSALPADAELYFDIVVEPLTGLNLSYWDGDTYPISWGPVPNGETIEFSSGSDLAVADGGSQRVEGFLIDTEPGSGGIHQHIDYHLRPTAGATGGIYLVALEASIVPVLPADAVAPSPRFWIVFRYDESSTDWNAAIAWVEANLDVPDCQDGYDNDGDGVADFDGGNLGAGNEDPGCDDLNDESETSQVLPCDDGIDNDGDGYVDHDPATSASPGSTTQDPAGTGDPVCRWPDFSREDALCQNGIDDDNTFGTDYDGGRSILGAGGMDPDGPDPTCGQPWYDREAPRGCGLGFELALALPLLMGLHRKRRMRRTFAR